MTINIDYCKYLKNKVKKVDYIINKLYNIIIENGELE